MNYRRNPIRMERAQQRLDAGTVSAQFPDVSGIVISMMYNQKGIKKGLQRTLNFSPSSYAFFRVDCLSKGCGDGGFDLTQVITSMVGNHREAAQGELSCGSDSPSADHSAIVYEVAIQYA
jgi:hypothetical protein